MSMVEEKIAWNVDLEVSLFHAMRRHKPVGLNRHFQMIAIHEKLNSAVREKISAKQIWRHLDTMYDLAALNESEIIPPPVTKETEFELTGEEYDELKEEDYPRATSDRVVEDLRDSPREREPRDSREAERAERHSKGGKASRDAERLSDSMRSEDSPKREHRKRTRGNIQSPADTTPTMKRARRN